MAVTLSLTVKNFSSENVAKMKLHSPNMYRRPQKNLCNISHEQVFTVDSYFGGMFNTRLPKSAKFSTFGHFLRYMGGRMRPKNCQPKNTLGQGALGPIQRILDLPGRRNYFFSDNTSGCSIDLTPKHMCLLLQNVRTSQLQKS